MDSIKIKNYSCDSGVWTGDKQFK